MKRKSPFGWTVNRAGVARGIPHRRTLQMTHRITARTGGPTVNGPIAGPTDGTIAAHLITTVDHHRPITTETPIMIEQTFTDHTFRTTSDTGNVLERVLERDRLADAGDQLRVARKNLSDFENMRIAIQSGELESMRPPASKLPSIRTLQPKAFSTIFLNPTIHIMRI